MTELPQPGTDRAAPAARLGLVRAAVPGTTAPADTQAVPLHASSYVQVWDLACGAEMVGWAPLQPDQHDTTDAAKPEAPAPMQLLAVSCGVYLTTSVHVVSRDGPLTVLRVDVSGTDSTAEHWPQHSQAGGTTSGAAQLLLLPLCFELWHSGLLLDTAHTVVLPPQPAAQAAASRTHSSTDRQPFRH